MRAVPPLGKDAPTLHLPGPTGHRVHCIFVIVREEGRKSRSALGWGAKWSPPSPNPHQLPLKWRSVEDYPTKGNMLNTSNCVSYTHMSS